MSLDIIKDCISWNKLVDDFEHDFYHTWEFHNLSYINNEGTPVLFLFKYEDKVLLFPLLERDIIGTEKKDLVSVYGYPGPLFSTDNVEDQNILLNKAFEEISSLGYVSLFSRLHPIINSQAIENSTKLGEIVYFDLNESLEDIYASMRKVHRRDVRKLKKSDFILKRHYKAISENISEFKKIYDLTMDKLGASSYYYFDENFYEKLFSSDNFKAMLYTVYFEDQAVASAVMMHTSVFGEYHLSGTLPEFYRDHPMKLILACAMEDMHSAGLKYFILGGGVGSKKDSLFDFKYGFARNTKSFSIVKRIFDSETYDVLTRRNFESLNIDYEKSQINYFPLYRYSE
ncbi:GNAT family N-acetyltransferase [Psychrobacter sp. T6-5]|uniref:GNAT family N-acetyltransferase n=1 Tax=Psychrobacter sp. T6-5 TaxID=3457451 RepID=UPI003FD26CF9